MNSAPYVLVVDDDRHARVILRSLLLEDGCRVAEAANGQAALDAYARFQPDLVLLDIMLPVMDGLEACARLQADAERRNVPILMLTALDDAQSVSQAFEAGASDVITKPYNLTVVRQRLRRLLRSKQLEDAIRRAKREWEATLDAVSDLVLVTGPDDRVIRCNRAASLHLRLACTEVVGRTLAELFYAEQRPTPEFCQAEAGPAQFPRLPGWFQIANYPVALADQGQGAVHVLRDVTRPVELEAARRATGEALQRSERQRRLPKILIAEDEPDLCSFLRDELAERRFSVNAVSNGADAIVAAAEEAYDLYLLDMLMPGLDGIQVIRVLRQLTPRVPILGLTGPVGRGCVAQASTYGVTCLSKPIQVDELLKEIDEALVPRPSE